MNEPAAKGDFHVLKMDGLFHVVFRPDSEPEWFRIIATFYTYDRAYCYCDIERVSSYETWDELGGNSDTATEEHEGLRASPIHLALPESSQENHEGIPELVRGIYDGGEHVEPHPIEDFSEQPKEEEPPKEYHDRQYAEALSREADKPICAKCGGPRSLGSASMCRKCYGKGIVDPDTNLTDKQKAVLEFFLGHANPLRLVNASYNEIAREAGVPYGSVIHLVETLERKGFVEVAERGGSNRSSVFRLVTETIIASAESAPA